MFHRSSKTSPRTIKVKNLDTIHLREPIYLPQNIKLVRSKEQVARNSCYNVMEGSKFTPVNTPKTQEGPTPPTPTEQTKPTIVAKSKKAAPKASNPEESSTPNVAMKPKKVAKAPTPREAAMSSTPIRPDATPKSSSPEDSEASIGPVQPEAGPNATDPQDDESYIGSIKFSDLTNRNMTSVESLHEALDDRNLDKRGNRQIKTARLLLYHIGFDLDGTNTTLQNRAYELVNTKMPALKVLLTRLNAALNPNESAKGTNKPKMVARVLEAEMAFKASSGDSGEVSSSSSPAEHGAQSTSPASGAGQNRRGSSSPTPAPSNEDLVAAIKAGDSKKRRRTEDSNDADDEHEKPISMKRQKTKDAGPETVGQLSGPPVQEAADLENRGSPDQDMDDGHDLDGPTLGAPDVDGLIGTPKSDVRQPQASLKSKSLQSAANVDPKMVDPEAESEPEGTDIDTSNAPGNGKNRKSAVTSDASVADTDLETPQQATVVRPKASLKGKKPQKSAHAIPVGGTAEAESKKRKREEPTVWNDDDVNAQNVPEKPHKRTKVTDDEAEHTDDDVGADVSKVLEEPQQLEEPTKPEDPKQSVKRTPTKDSFIYNGILDTKILFEDTVVPPEVLNATCRIMTGCGIMDDVNMVHQYRLGLRKYQKSHEHDHDPQKKGWRKWWAVQTFWESRVSDIEVSATSDGQSDADSPRFDVGNGNSKMQPKFDNVDDEILYDCTEGATTGDDLAAYNQRIKERDDLARNAQKKLRKEESELLDDVPRLESLSLDAYYTQLWKPQTDEEMSKEEKLRLREEEKAIMELLGIKVASEAFREIRRSHDGRW
ncbi:allantoate permease [Physcia stellaris]|nr:allantoate permease [Physcia stellaris]